MIDMGNMYGSTPIDDISGLIPKYVRTRDELYECEFENIVEATGRYLTRTRALPITRKNLYRVHKEMFGKVWQWAGTPRTGNLNIGSKSFQIEADMENLLADLEMWRQDPALEVLDEAVFLHHRLVKIHPFYNGNGRWARLVVNIYLRNHKQPILTWPEADMFKGNDFRNRYIRALKDADQGDYEPLLSIHYEQV